jgi:hypothetical protein
MPSASKEFVSAPIRDLLPDSLVQALSDLSETEPESSSDFEVGPVITDIVKVRRTVYVCATCNSHCLQRKHEVSNKSTTKRIKTV